MKRLGDILVESGFLNATELAEVLSVQKETGIRSRQQILFSASSALTVTFLQVMVQ